MTGKFDKFDTAVRMGPLALIRLRAETLLRRVDDPDRPIKITDELREMLDRIASAPLLSDKEFLGTFDHIYEQDERDGGNA